MAERDRNADMFTMRAADANHSLSQWLLAPLDALFKAQVHAARSFLSLIGQLGYRHQPVDPSDRAAAEAIDKTPYMMDFFYKIEGTDRMQKVSVPALSLVPVAPLGVESAEFEFSIVVEEIGRHQQIHHSEQESVNNESQYDQYHRPWFLVQDPLSIRGTITSVESRQERAMHVKVKVGRIGTPTGLEKLLTSLTQTIRVEET